MAVVDSASRLGGAVPSYDDLPVSEHGGRHAWNVPVCREKGTLGFITSEATRRAAGLVTAGEVFSLNAPLDCIDPPLFGRDAVKHAFEIKHDGLMLDDRLDAFCPQISSQWDALNHVGVVPGQFFGGASIDDQISGGANGIDVWAREGIAGRGVLVDLVPHVGALPDGYDPSDSPPTVSVAMLESALEAQGVALEFGDILLLHTGFLEWYRRQERSVREQMRAAGPQVQAVGVEHSESVARFLWDAGVAAVATDSIGFETWPPDRTDRDQPFGFLHRALIGQLGYAIGELWDLDRLVRYCRDKSRWELLVVSAPLHLRGGVGSPSNALGLL